MKIQKYLTEDFSKSMPHWLRGYLLNQTKDNLDVNRYLKRGYDLSRYSSNKSKDYMVNQLSGVSAKQAQSMTIYQKLTNMGYDLSSAVFTEVPVPSNKNDDLFSKDSPIFDGKIYFYRLVWEDSTTGYQREQVWARGINDYEVFEARGNRERLGKLPTMPNVLLEYTENICYMYKSDTNLISKNKVNARKSYNNNNDLSHPENIVNNKFSPNSKVQVGDTEYETDKSGYISNLAQTLSNSMEDTLSKIRFVKYSNKYLSNKMIRSLNEYRNEILEIKRLFLNYISSQVVREGNLSNTYILYNVGSTIQRALSCLNEDLQWLEFMNNSNEIPKESIVKFQNWFFSGDPSTYLWSYRIPSYFGIDAIPDGLPSNIYCQKYLQDQMTQAKEDSSRYQYDVIDLTKNNQRQKI